MKEIAVENGGFVRRIYETSDAAIQLEDFYSSIASPLLYDVTVEYVGASFSEKTRSGFYTTFYKGGEYIVAGKIKTDMDLQEEMRPEIIINAFQYLPQKYERRILPCYVRHEKNISFTDSETFRRDDLFLKSTSLCIPLDKPKMERSDAENFIERLWAYLTIQNLLDETNVKLDPSAELSTTPTHEKHTKSNDNANLEMAKSDRDRALEIALKYNFVTDITSLLVSKPIYDENKSILGRFSAKFQAIVYEQIATSQSTSLKPNNAYSTTYVNQQQFNYEDIMAIFPISKNTTQHQPLLVITM